jgi:hypothetical protein
MRHRDLSFHRIVLVAALLAASLGTAGCLLSDADVVDEGVVRSETADVFSSTALVSLKVASVKRGDQVEILRRESVAGPTYTEEWVQIRLNDDAETSGWLEARHVVSEKVVEQSKEIAGSPEELPAIAMGRLKVNQRLRLGPDRTADSAAVISRGTEFEIIGKERSTYKPEPKEKTDDVEAEAAAEAEAVEEPEERTDTWYRVRLGGDSIIHGGWILANSVSLQVPDEILHLEGDGRRFVAWQAVGSVVDPRLAEREPERAKKFHYVTFMKRGTAPGEIDFERIYCLFWDPDAHTYYAPYVDSDLRGVFPIRQRTEGGRTIVTASVLDAQDKPVEIELEVVPTDKGRMTVRRITPPVAGERLSQRRR